MLRPGRPSPRQRGFTLVEILVTVVILLIGIAGVLGLQAKASVTELESYQRGQALSLVRDMAARIAASRALLADLGVDTLSSTDGGVYFGVAGSGTVDLGECIAPSATSSGAEVAIYQVCEWARALQGSAEGGSAGAMIGARGCLIRNPPPAGALADFHVVVVWQGVAIGPEPPGMAAGESPTPMSRCAAPVDLGAGLRRAAVLRVLVPALV